MKRENRRTVAGFVAATWVFVGASALTADDGRPHLLRIVRGKLSAADLASAEAWVEDWARDYGADETYWKGMGWLARGARMLGEEERALEIVSRIRTGPPGDGSVEHLDALGAALETEGLILAVREGREAAARHFREASTLSSDVAFRSRMWKNVNRLELVGKRAPEVAVDTTVGASVPTLEELRGRPVLLFLWAHWCGDCRASVPTLAAIMERFGPRGLELVAPTRLYGEAGEVEDPTPQQELAHVAAVLDESYASLPGLRVPVDSDTMIRYGASSTPTFILVDRGGIVRFYAPTRLTVDALADAIEPLIAPEPDA